MQKENLFRSLNWLVIAGILMLLTLSVTLYKSWDGISDANYQTVSVSGEGIVYVTPDVATLEFTINEVKSSSKDAQNIANNKMIAVKKVLADLKVEDKDIKSMYYTVSPKYNYDNCQPTYSYVPCTPKQKLEGYEVSHNVSVKVRDLDNAGKVLEALGAAGVNNVSGPNFVVDDMAKSKEEARGKAIADAKAKAKVLSGQLGLDFDDIYSYSESDNHIYDRGYGATDYDLKAMPVSPVTAPIDVSAGQNKVVSNITILYKLK